MRWIFLLCLAIGCSKEAPPSKTANGSADRESVGRLPPEQIQGIVRDHYLIFRKCYEAGLTRNPELTGLVTVRFVIDEEGRVNTPELVKSTLPDEEATKCIVEEYRQLQFPRPEGGKVTVVYPIRFSPG